MRSNPKILDAGMFRSFCFQIALLPEILFDIILKEFFA